MCVKVLVNICKDDGDMILPFMYNFDWSVSKAEHLFMMFALLGTAGVFARHDRELIRLRLVDECKQIDAIDRMVLTPFCDCLCCDVAFNAS